MAEITEQTLTCVDVKIWFDGEVSLEEASNILSQRVEFDERVHSFLVGPPPTPLQRLSNLEKQCLSFSKTDYDSSILQMYFSITARQIQGIREDLEAEATG